MNDFNQILGAIEFFEGLFTQLKGKDAYNAQQFVRALKDKVMSSDAEKIARMLVDFVGKDGIAEQLGRAIGRMNPKKLSLGNLFGFDPFKEFRLACDEFAREHGLDWRRV